MDSWGLLACSKAWVLSVRHLDWPASETCWHCVQVSCTVVPVLHQQHSDYYCWWGLQLTTGLSVLSIWLHFFHMMPHDSVIQTDWKTVLTADTWSPEKSSYYSIQKLLKENIPAHWACPMPGSLWMGHVYHTGNFEITVETVWWVLQVTDSKSHQQLLFLLPSQLLWNSVYACTLTPGSWPVRPQSSTFGRGSPWINKSIKKSSLDLRGDRLVVSSKVIDGRSQNGVMMSP